MSLKWRMSLLVSGLLAAAIGGLAAVLMWSEGRALTRAAEKRQADLVAGLAEVCRGTLFSKQDLLVTNYLRHLKALPEVVEARCVGADGRVIGHTRFELMGTVLPPAERPAPVEAAARGETRASGRSLLKLAAPVQAGGQTGGTAEVLFSKEAAEARLHEELAGARRRILGLSGPVLLAGFAGAFLLTALLLGPVQSLVAGADAIGAGRLDHAIPEGRADELGHLARAFNRMAARLAELDRMKQDFVNGVTHDLKNPLTAIRASADLIEAKLPKDPHLAEKLFSIRRNVEKLRDLITSILEVAKIESGLVLNKKPVSLEEVTRRAAEGLRAAAEGKGVALEVVIHDDLPPLDADEDKLERAVANLLSNAVKFTGKGEVTAELMRAEGCRQLVVRDTGPGIPPELLPRLFTKFSRGSEAVEGTGLGLAIVKGIVEAHGGSVSVDSAPGRGAAFTVRFPIS